ncbi:hypothetical protein [Sphingomonas sp. Leaf37]|uniref:hypothetical protein n=1 Tax=Sphingomonas sp. Leaf37 TaxID=2876552 RepID=UPI001E3CEE2D|nr:hypothetical protein [Sphingomonas sp. Leaf37]
MAGRTGRQTSQRTMSAPGTNWTGRIAEMAAIFMVGDGLVGLVQPRRHVDLWKDDALGAEKAVAPFVDRPGRRRLYAAAQITAGLWLAGIQRPR